MSTTGTASLIENGPVKVLMNPKYSGFLEA
jgi:hypothetical protein